MILVLTHRPPLSLFLPVLELCHLPPGALAEEPAEGAIIKAEDGRQDGQPVEEAEVAADDQHHLQHGYRKK